MRRLVILLLVMVAAGYAVRWLERHRPQDLPWTPLRVDMPIGLFTSMKLARLSGDKAACIAILETANFSVQPMRDRSVGARCGYVDAVVLTRMTAAYEPATVRLACPLAAGLAVWERQVLQPAARSILGSDVAAIRHYGTFNCRRIAGSERWSRHAHAQAIDIAGFGLADGRRVTLAADWDGDDEESRFLKRVRDGACRVFGTVLGPDYNSAHRDHFHLEAGGFGLCR